MLLYDIQMGSFNAGGRRYSLMTMDALKASRQRRDDGMPPPVTSNTTTIHMGNLLHAIEPVSDDEMGIVDEYGKHRHQLYLVFWATVCKTVRPMLPELVWR